MTTPDTTLRTSTGCTARLVGLSVRTIQRWCDAGMDHDYHGTWRMVSIDDVGRWLARHRSYCGTGNFTVAQRQRLYAMADTYARRIELDRIEQEDSQ